MTDEACGREVAGAVAAFVSHEHIPYHVLLKVGPPEEVVQGSNDCDLLDHLIRSGEE
jgi:hypothetical protein